MQISEKRQIKLGELLYDLNDFLAGIRKLFPGDDDLWRLQERVFAEFELDSGTPILSAEGESANGGKEKTDE